jgi:hypothetical protein
MFLSDTHLDTYLVECLRKRLKMDFKIVNPLTTCSGGVMLLWKNLINIQQKISAPNYIDACIHESPNKESGG